MGDEALTLEGRRVVVTGATKRWRDSAPSGSPSASLWTCGTSAPSRSPCARRSPIWGGVDMVVNNAGIGMRTVNPRFFDRPQPFFEVEPASFDDVMATKLRGYYLVASEFGSWLAEHRAQRGAR